MSCKGGLHVHHKPRRVNGGFQFVIIRTLHEPFRLIKFKGEVNHLVVLDVGQHIPRKILRAKRYGVGNRIGQDDGVARLIRPPEGLVRSD